MKPDIPRGVLTKFVGDLMKIQKRFAHEQVGAKNDRRGEVQKLINRTAAELEGKRAD